MPSHFIKIEWIKDAGESGETTTEITKALASNAEEGIDANLGNAVVTLVNKLTDLTNGYGEFGATRISIKIDEMKIYLSDSEPITSADLIFWGVVDSIKCVGKPKSNSVTLTCRNLMYKVMSRLISQAYVGNTSSEIFTNIAGQLGVTVGTVDATTEIYDVSWSNTKAVDALMQLTNPDATGGKYYMIYFSADKSINYVEKPQTPATVAGDEIYLVWGPALSLPDIDQTIIFEYAIERDKSKLTNMVFIDAGFDMNEQPIVTEEWDMSSIIEFGFQEDDYNTKDITEQLKFNESIQHGNKPSEYPSAYPYAMTFADPDGTVTKIDDESHTLNGVAWSNMTGTCVAFSENVTNTAGTTTYTRDVDYEMDYTVARIRRIVTGSITDGQTVYIDFTTPAALAASDSDFNDFIVEKAKKEAKDLINKLIDELKIMPWKGTVLIRGTTSLQLGWIVNVVIPRLADNSAADFSVDHPVKFRIKNIRHRFSQNAWRTELALEEFVEGLT